ncbi:MAG: hypothetical protein KatS3mg008_0963 [Acidimicrobiales bacterium]|nr:MAG: hypothetical protein KatS3mg008_0963 [Acidimicrobiales bacterium]
MQDTRVVHFYFDPLCPWAFRTSLWMRDVRDRLDLAVEWRFFSLEEVNREEGSKHPWEREWSYGWSLMRIGAYLRRLDPDLLDRWYLLVGTALHLEGRKAHRREVAEELLDEMGLGAETAAAALADATTHDEVRREHQQAVERGYFGVPTLYFPEHGQSLFGPVISEPLEAERSIALWEHVVSWLGFPRLYEIKRPKSAEDLAHISQKFQPYLAARDWRTVQKPAP